MSRDLDVDLVTAVEETVVRPFLAIRIELPDPVTVWSGVGNLVFDDSDSDERTWLGAGGVGAIDTIGEGTDGSATGIKVSLLQVPSEFAEDIADQATKGALFEVYAGALNETFQVVEAVSLIWRGRLDQFIITDGGSSLTVEVTGESRGLDQRRPSVKRFTDETQQRNHPGDLFFQYTSQLVEVPILWAKASQNTAPVGGSGGGGAGGGPAYNGDYNFQF